MRIIQEGRPLTVPSHRPGARLEWPGDRRKSVSGLLSASAFWPPWCLGLCPSMPSVLWNCEPKQTSHCVVWLDICTVTRKSAYTWSLTTEPSAVQNSPFGKHWFVSWPRKGIETYKWVICFCGASQGAVFLSLLNLAGGSWLLYHSKFYSN